MASRWPGNLRAGALLLGLLALLALAAPWLATERPWLAASSEGIVCPVLRDTFGRSGPAGPAPRALLQAPVAHGPLAIDLDARLEPPSRLHWLGTDELGRDLGARLLHGARVSLGVGLLTALLALLIGLPLGAAAGYAGGITDAAVSRLIEAVLCFPVLVLALALLAVAPRWLGDLPDAARVALVLGVAGWVPVARYLRGEFMRLRSADMVAAARAAGAGHLRIVTRHILPSAWAPVLVTTSFSVGAAILIEATLSFIGVGVTPPTPSWGELLKQGATHVDRAWWLTLFPGAALFLTVLGCNLLGEGIRDRLDPRSPR